MCFFPALALLWQTLSWHPSARAVLTAGLERSQLDTAGQGAGKESSMAMALAPAGHSRGMKKGLAQTPVLQGERWAGQVEIKEMQVGRMGPKGR